MKIKDLIFDSTSSSGLKKAQLGKSKFYLGVDPTGDSLHIGHLSTIIFAKRLIELGNKAILVVGSATAQIGDPSGKKTARQPLDLKTIKTNTKKLTSQLEKYFSNDILIVNNNDWLQKLKVIDFLRDYGKLFNISSMIKKDIVASRLEKGISYTEFTYQVLQAIDFMHLTKQYNCDFQIGGQDQWGNITAGLELIKKTDSKKNVFGLTIPLITKSDGTKFGKTELGNIWLDAKKTSPYVMYQFLKNVPDSEVISLIKRLTFINQSNLAKLEKEVKINSKARMAQSYLADNVVKFIHSQQDLKRAKEISKILFSGNISQLSFNELTSCLSNVPTTIISKNIIDIQDLLVKINAAKSRREAREFIANASIMLNGKKISDPLLKISIKNALNKKMHIVKKGKRKFFIVKY